jgi:4-amino-4-deoxy-L-arabinose transferase-like glycosyltransferase
MAETPRDASRTGNLEAILNRWRWLGPALVIVLGLLVFGSGVSSQKPFADESAYLTQSFYAELLVSGRVDDPAWVDMPGYDLPPLPKYLIASALWAGGYRVPTPADAVAWYRDINRRFDPPGAMAAARWPTVAIGVTGCLALYGLGTLAGGRLVGVVAAVLLIENPLFRVHARRAMSDVPAESFVLVALFLALLAWKNLWHRRSLAAAWLKVIFSGVATGLALLSKLSGLLAPMVTASWMVLAVVLRRPIATKLWVVLAFGVTLPVATLVRVGLDPFLTAHPTGRLAPPAAEIARMSTWERARLLPRHRLEVSAFQKKRFPHNALHSLKDKFTTTLVQGFGRFGPFGPSEPDSKIRYDPRQDWGVVIWLPLVGAGACWAALQGRWQNRSGELPTAWAVLLHFAIALGVVSMYVPMAWDRYFLPFQAPACLLAAGAASSYVNKIITGRSPRAVQSRS